jgi:transposase
LIGRSHGGLGSKIHVLLDALGNPCRILLSEAQRADIKLADELIRDIHSDAVVADKGYDSNKFIATIKERGAEVNRRVATRNYTARNYLAVVQIAASLILLL